MADLKKILPTGVQNDFGQEVWDVIRKYQDTLPAIEIFALMANLLGRISTFQVYDQSALVSVVERNFEAGVAEMLETHGRA